ncbi:MAG: translocation/assembly module TamB, partial [Flavobacterium sp.]
MTKLIKRGIKKFKKILLRSILGLVLLLLTLAILLTLPFVQTKIASYLTEQINKDYDVDIQVSKVAISIFGNVKLKEVLVRDHHADTLFHITRIQTNILSFRKLGDSKLLFGALKANDLYFNLKTYKGETDSNLDRFIAAFDDGKPSTGKFVLNADELIVKNSRFVLSDYNQDSHVSIDFYELNGILKDFQVKGADVSTYIQKLDFKDFRGLTVQNLEADLLYTKKNILLKSLSITTPESKIKGSVELKYQRSDFENFNNKVVFEIDLKEAVIASNDIRYFYDEIGAHQKFYLKTKLDGTLNNFTLKQLLLRDDNGTLVDGSITFRNLLSRDENKFRMIGDFNRVESNYNDLVQILPNILGKTLPDAMRYFGNFTLRGTADLTLDYIKTNFSIDSPLGRLEGVLDMNQMDNSDNAIYQGNLRLVQFDVGKFIGEKDLGNVTAYFEVNGQGLTQQSLDVFLKGQVNQLYYNNYNYTGILADGRFKMPFFSGKLNVNDPNLFMDFDGTIDLSDKIKNYEFELAIDYADLHKLNFVNDSISVFRGNITSNLRGTNINDFAGSVYITQSAYQNARDIYVFDDLKIASFFDVAKERVITLSSPDIVDGKITGKFYFEEVIDMVENALGSIYANYKPNKVRPGQYLRFQFSIYNKIIEIFYPEIELSSNTFLRGSINSDNNVFKLNFNTPRITAFENKFHNINLEIDNKNPLYNTYMEVDSVRTPFYKISDFSLINLTINDTLYFRSEFKGGDLAQDYYNLNVYHSIDDQNQSIVGIQKSELHFKDYLWYLNENDDKKNR